ncbi:DegT/DnrJ/EryC1/StrS family aminotransferase [Paenibacillus sp. UMB4589-SE434]|uniref:DegT/DnrJ/EryC1/StrS family aminotransferase n=1 Tax=Paenibacillus sp. UMB4589-SE434 TaxID=3046314 RepID=UPI0025513113|nr:DegT/DnrJ/EryC1/StrS family aminotransferase [Paenibacillus sp. UMB4589-SE434]MDK8182438.1 DegT/DnrJ/EryC1/StrS family aminotransferase [Paenibacillus sp. UMB4589-SE434]
MNIPLFVPTYRVDECLAEIRDCLEKGWTGLGYKTVEFEERWKEYTGFKHAHFLHSATAGLSLAIEVLKMTKGWKKGDEIITTPLTFVSTNHTIRYHALKPVFADVDSYLCLDPDDMVRRITPRTRAVLFVGMSGNTGQYERIVKLCEQYGLALILDAAHMAGTRLHGCIPGKEADAVVYSFQAVKNLPTADGGMVCFHEEAQDHLVRKLSWLGINKDTYTRTNAEGQYRWLYDVEHVGYKYHGNSIMAAIGLVQLRYLDQDNAYRKQLCTWYEQALADVKSIIPFIPVAPDCDSSRHLFMISAPARNELLALLNENGIFPGVHYRINTAYRMYRHARGQCPTAETMSDRIISLPLHLRMTYADVQTIASVIKQYVSNL